MDKSPLHQKLELLGLTEKESSVYVAALQTGAAPVQTIAKAADLKRPTAYLIIESLVGKGLLSSVAQGKKTYFVAEDPSNLERLLLNKRAELDHQTSELKNLIPQLEVLFRTTGERPTVRLYEGLEGLEAIRRDFLNPQYTEVFSMSDIDKVIEMFPTQNEVTRTRINKKIKSKVLYTSDKGILPWINDPAAFRETRFMPRDKFPFDGDITIYGDKVAISSFHKRPVSVLVENRTIAEMMRSMFRLAWQGAAEYNP